MAGESHGPDGDQEPHVARLARQSGLAGGEFRVCCAVAYGVGTPRVLPGRELPHSGLRARGHIRHDVSDSARVGIRHPDEPGLRVERERVVAGACAECRIKREPYERVALPIDSVPHPVSFLPCRQGLLGKGHANAATRERAVLRRLAIAPECIRPRLPRHLVTARERVQLGDRRPRRRAYADPRPRSYVTAQSRRFFHYGHCQLLPASDASRDVRAGYGERTRWFETPTVIRDEHVCARVGRIPYRVGAATRDEAPVDRVRCAWILRDVERAVLCVGPEAVTHPIVTVPPPAVRRVGA